MPTVATPLLTEHVSQLASRQHGLVDRDELKQLGASDGWIAWQVRRRRLHRIHPGVFAVGHCALSREASWSADVRAHGPGAALAGFAAAAAWKLTRRRSMPVTVVVPRQRRAVGGVRIATASWMGDHRTTWNGIPILTPAGTIAFLAARVGVGELVQLIAQAEFHQYRVLGDLRRLVGDRRFRSGTPRLRLALAQYVEGDRGSESGFECAVYRIVEDVLHERPVRNLELTLPEVGDVRLDLAWRGPKLNVEADGPGHLDPYQQRRDAARDQELAALGWTTIRVPVHEFEAAPLIVARELRERIAHVARLGQAP